MRSARVVPSARFETVSYKLHLDTQPTARSAGMVARPPSVCDLRITLSTLPAAGRLPASADATASPQTGTLPLTSTASEPIGDSSKSRKSMAPWQFGLRKITDGNRFA
ncbi:hypothetical protein KM043_002922 [Ampulex compressa]|nr:hypothetical protein KM043_002922 [Ampulex compressa]